ncbi:NAD dependent epimerase/dehydratase family protein [Serratia symbiotica]|nr:NAD dependent epimerase/dehydratase family protein [Serratia symbiotica]
MKYLITGVAGFIGYHLAIKLLNHGHEIVGIDNLNNYYDINLKIARLNLLKNYSKFYFIKTNISNKNKILKIFNKYNFQRVIHLASQVGVRYSLKNPFSYINTNIIGYLNILEGCRYNKIEHLLYASSSSVYGLNNKLPFSTSDSSDHPISIYAITKKTNELMSHNYSYLYKIPSTGLRFFTVYGPWGRPDMALFKFTKAILEGKNIDIYNYGKMYRDFTYIDDIIEVIFRLQKIIPSIHSNDIINDKSLINNLVPYNIYNIGNRNPIKLIKFVNILENELGIHAQKNMLPIQPGDVINTHADTSKLYNIINFEPTIDIKKGIKFFVDWYRKFY